MMTADERHDTPVKTKAFMVDPQTMTILWSSEAATRSPAAEVGAAPTSGGSVEQAVPLADRLGIVRAIGEVATTGEPYHAHADVIPTRRGSMALAASVYRLPEGTVLVLVENSWQHASRRGNTTHGSSMRAQR